MNDEKWIKFFTICAEILGKGDGQARFSDSWCCWTTFDVLENDIRYFTRGLPNKEDLTETAVKDSPSAWGEPISYRDIAHILIPRKFYWETPAGPEFQTGYKTQDINKLSQALLEAGIEHRTTDVLLEIKLF